MKHLTLPLAVVAGFVGGALSHYFLPSLPTGNSAATPTMVSAQSFAIVDARGKPVGIFAAGATSRAANRSAPVALFNAEGKEVWRAGDAGQPLLTAQ